MSDRLIMTLDHSSKLWATDLTTERRAVIGEVAESDTATGCLTVDEDGSVYAGIPYRNRNGLVRFAIVRLTTRESWLPPPRSTPEIPPVGPSSTSDAERISHTTPADTPSTPDSLDEQGTPAPDAPTPPPRPSGDNAAAASPHDATQQRRLADQREGNRDGFSLTMDLPLFAVEAAISANFDPIRWLKPWRERWGLIATGRTSPDPALTNWLPLVARYLGTYAAPPEAVESHFTPSHAYVAGFGHGIRAAWEGATRRRIVPSEAATLHDWLRKPVAIQHSDGAPVRGSMTLKDLRTTAIKDKGVSAWKWLGRIALWSTTILFGIGTLVAIILSLTDGWPTKTVANTVGGLLFYSVPFAILLWLTVRDWRRRRRSKSARSRSDP